MTDASAAEPLRLEVVAEELATELGPELRSAIQSHGAVRALSANADLWIVSLEALDKEGDEEPWFRAVLADMSGSDVVEAEGSMWNLDTLMVTPTSRHRLPHEDEHAWAVEMLRNDGELARRIDAGEIEVYRPLPPLASVQQADGSIDRAVTVGLRETAADGTTLHRVVAIRSADGEVIPLGEPVAQEHGVPDGPECPAGAGEPQARIRLWRGDEKLWDLVAVRPSASSGSNGSGVELRAVDFRGVRVLHRAHLPIVTVAYEDGSAARNWLSQESCFEAEGDEPVPGFRVCEKVPGTVLDRGQGGGGFRGVALCLDGEELVLISQLEAGWHRYVCQWRLSAEGTLRPRVGFAAVRNPRTEATHRHHAYWRLDFDIVAAENNQVQEHNDPTLPGGLARWHTVRYEVARRRDPGHNRYWRVRTVRSPHGYSVVPGPQDGTADEADEFGAGDVWVLAYHAEELDDGEGVTSQPARARAQLDRLVSGELVERTDLVLWYGVHVDGEPQEPVGPDLVPFNWKPLPEKEAYEPLVPPKLKGPEDEEDEE